MGLGFPWARRRAAATRPTRNTALPFMGDYIGISAAGNRIRIVHTGTDQAETLDQSIIGSNPITFP